MKPDRRYNRYLVEHSWTNWHPGGEHIVHTGTTEMKATNVTTLRRRWKQHPIYRDTQIVKVTKI